MSAVEMDATRDFYDEFFDHLLYDRLRLNPRHSVVAQLLRRYSSPGSLLDLGCGIGITSELAARRGRRVVGVDLSPVLIEYARATVPGVTFHVGDIATIELGERFETVTLFDVYEHVPAERRGELWQNVERHLADRGRVLMTVPHPAATEQSEVEHEGAMQIVDEVVQPAELLAAASAVGLLPRQLSAYAVDRDPEYYWIVLERSMSPAPHARRRWSDPVQRLRVRVRARRYWRAARDFRRG